MTCGQGRGRSRIKYRQVDPELRAHKQHSWNKPIIWPLFLGLALLCMLVLPVLWHFRKKAHAPPKRLLDRE